MANETKPILELLPWQQRVVKNITVLLLESPARPGGLLTTQIAEGLKGEWILTLAQVSDVLAAMENNNLIWRKNRRWNLV